jgi:glycosyltransferase involved in cell wall biosynthesis
MVKISGFIIAKNEQTHIAKAIISLRAVADEVIVVDSGSTDNTVSIASLLGAKVVFNAWNGYLAQKIYGESLCAHDWIINIDADEELSEELIAEINSAKKTKLLGKFVAYKLKIAILYRNEIKPRLFAPINNTIRFYNKNYAGFSFCKGDSTHDKVKLKDPNSSEYYVSYFRYKVYHRSGTSITQLVNKANFYSTEQAEAMFFKGRKISTIRIFLEFPLWIFKAFFLRRYFVFGADGLIDSIIFAFARFIRLAKLREIYKQKDYQTIHNHNIPDVNNPHLKILDQKKNKQTDSKFIN